MHIGKAVTVVRQLLASNVGKYGQHLVFKEKAQCIFLSVTIKPEAVDPEDVEMLQDLVVSAVNEALRQANDAMENSMNGFTGGLDLSSFGL